MEAIEIGKLILILVGMILTLIGAIMIFDAIIITKKIFSFGDQNEGVFSLKIVGLILVIIGGLIFVI